jgi:hypothetical protein
MKHYAKTRSIPSAIPENLQLQHPEPPAPRTPSTRYAQLKQQDAYSSDVIASSGVNGNLNHPASPTSLMSRVSRHDREDFYIEKRSKSFAIMKGGRQRGQAGFQGRVGLSALRPGEDLS